MTRLPLPAALALLLAASPALADPGGLVGRALGTTLATVATALEAEGYEIVEVDSDSDEFEFDVLWEGTRYEIDVERAGGTVRAVERD